MSSVSTESTIELATLENLFKLQMLSKNTLNYTIHITTLTLMQ